MKQNELVNRILSSIVLIPIVLFVIIKGHTLFNIFLIICFLISIFEWYNMTKNTNFFKYGVFFLLISFYSLYQIRKFDYYDPTYLLIVLLICVLTDIGGYLFGKMFKGPKLTKFSPNKTYSGMFGGYFFSLLCLILISNLNKMIISNSIIVNIFFIFIISSISQIGDITISIFKRKSNIKDTGYIIPGHGGILDRIDGMILAFPFSYVIYLLFLK